MSITNEMYKRMKSISSITSFLLLSMLGMAQSPVEVVQKQLDTYNAQDIEAFSATFHEDAQIFMNLGDADAAMSGRAQIKESYGKMFTKNPSNRITLIGRMVQGNFVFDHEWIKGRDKEFKIVAIYEVEAGLIKRAWFAR